MKHTTLILIACLLTLAATAQKARKAQNPDDKKLGQYGTLERILQTMENQPGPAGAASVSMFLKGIQQPHDKFLCNTFFVALSKGYSSPEPKRLDELHLLLPTISKIAVKMLKDSLALDTLSYVFHTPHGLVKICVDNHPNYSNLPITVYGRIGNICWVYRLPPEDQSDINDREAELKEIILADDIPISVSDKLASSLQKNCADIKSIAKVFGTKPVKQKKLKKWARIIALIAEPGLHPWLFSKLQL